MNEPKDDSLNVGKAFVDMIFSVMDGKPVDQAVNEFVYGKRDGLEDMRKVAEWNQN